MEEELQQMVLELHFIVQADHSRHPWLFYSHPRPRPDCCHDPALLQSRGRRVKYELSTINLIFGAKTKDKLYLILILKMYFNKMQGERKKTTLPIKFLVLHLSFHLLNWFTWLSLLPWLSNVFHSLGHKSKKQQCFKHLLTKLVVTFL